MQELAEQIDQLLYNKNQEMQNDSKENVSLQDYIQKEAEVSNDEELLELLKQLEELSEEEAHGIFESNLIEEGVKMRSDLLAKLSSLSPEKRAWLQKQMQKKENKEALPLSYAQQRLWFMDRFNPNSSLYNIPTVWHLKGNWIPEALEKGFNRLIERHESLRTVLKK